MEQRSGCKRCRTWEEEMYWKHFSSVHFFLFLPNDFHHHLVLPAKFAENMTAELPDKVSLIGPSATMWDIELKKTDAIELSGDGWKEFVKAYELEEKDLLMFKYNQNVGFEVLIFDPESFCEKEKCYFVKQCRHKRTEYENGKKRTVAEAFSMEVSEDKDDDDNDCNESEFLVSKKPRNGVSEKQGRLKNSQTPRKDVVTHAPRGRGRPKRMLGSSESSSKLEAQSEKEPKENGVHDVVEKEPKENGAADEQGHVSEKEQNTVGNKASVLRTVRFKKSAGKKGRPKKITEYSRKLVFRSEKKPEENGLVDNVVEQEVKDAEARKEQSHVKGREQNPLENGEIVLKTAHCYKSTEKKGKLKKRVPAKSLRKLLLQSDSAEKKYSNMYKSNRRPVSEIEKENALRRAAQGLTTDRSFISVMRPTAVYKRFYLHIPLEWMNKHLPCRNQRVVLRMEEKTWTALFYYHSKRGGGIAGYGWKRFAVDNFLEEFDACVFKLCSLKDDPEIVMDVEIFRVIPEIVPPSPARCSTLA